MADPFERIVGAEYASRPDGETLDGVPVVAVLRPADAGQVAACLAEARAHGLAVVPSGGGSKLALGNRSRADELVRLDLGRLAEPAEVQPDEGIASFGAGVPAAQAERLAAERGMRTTLETGFAGATVGGTIAADPVGVESSLDQRLRHDLLGLEVALPNGTVTHCGGRVVKNVTGFDLVRLYCGSFGTLGVITRATLRVHPLPESRAVFARECASLADAHVCAGELAEARSAPCGIAIVPSARGARCLWRIQGGAEDAGVRAERVAGDALAEQDWEQVRALVTPAADEDAVSVRVAARPSDTLALCRALADAGGGVRLAMPGAGVALGHVTATGLGPLWERCERERWLLVLERAPVTVKERFDVFGPGHDALAVMRAVKQRFDPDGCLAPGRFVGGL